MEKSRDEIMMEMQKELAESGMSFFTEVAVPGCKPDAVNPDDVNT